MANCLISQVTIALRLPTPRLWSSLMFVSGTAESDIVTLVTVRCEIGRSLSGDSEEGRDLTPAFVTVGI